jgi:hypothetical protein
MARLTRYVMSCLLGDLKVLRLPAVCVLLMVGSDVLQQADFGISLLSLSADALPATLYGYSTWRPLSCAEC